MEQKITTQKVKTYLKNNWFKLGLAALLLFVVLKKDLSFNLNLNTPLREEVKEKESIPVQQERKKKTTEKFTDNLGREEQSPSKTSSVVDRFDLSGFRGESNTPSSKTAFERLTAVDEEVKEAFMKRFAHVAVSEQRKFGIPASVILANALLHSAAGTKNLSRATNNYFGIQCTEDWHGESVEQKGVCYRQYENAWTSFRDHSFYITTGNFAKLKKLGAKDYKAWAKALEKQDFSKEPKLARRLTNIIETYELTILDEE